MATNQENTKGEMNFVLPRRRRDAERGIWNSGGVELNRINGIEGMG
jgi:hypothetical protein